MLSEWSEGQNERSEDIKLTMVSMWAMSRCDVDDKSVNGNTLLHVRDVFLAGLVVEQGWRESELQAVVGGGGAYCRSGTQ